MDVQSSIIKTLAFFNLFSHPLTNFELRQLLYTQEPVDFFAVLKEVESLKPKIQARDGFFFLLDRPGGLAQKHQARSVSNDKKFRIAQKAARLISWVPFVKLVAVCNTLSFGAAEEKSDIDFFIIGKKGRIWTARFFITAVLSLFGLRRHGRKIKNRICLSFYLADDSLDLRPIALPEKSVDVGDGFKPSPTPDIYLIYWITQIVPLLNRGQTLEKFWQANLWVKNYLANFDFASQLPDFRQIRIPRWVESWRLFHERLMAGWLGDWREKIFRWFQLKKMAGQSRSQARLPNTSVVISDQMLKFHEEDRREEFREKWAKT